MSTMAENVIAAGAENRPPMLERSQNTIELPEGNNVVPFRSDTIRLVQNGCSFHGFWSEDANQHLKDFLKLVNSLDLDSANRERIRLRLFQFSLHDQASNWLECVLAGSISIWEDLTTRFLAQFFPLGRTAKLCNNILIRTIDQLAGGNLRDKNAKESWVLLEDLALYDNESWNNPRDFAKPVKVISLPQDVPSTFDRRLIKLEHQVQRLMEAYISLMQPTQVNKITSSCKICSGPHDNQYCMENPKQAFVDYVSSHTDKTGNKQFAMNQGPRSFNEATNAWKGKPNFNWAHAQKFTSPRNGSFSTYSSTYQMKLEKALIDFDSHQEKRLSSLRTQLGQQQDNMISKINLLWKTISKKLNDTLIRNIAGSPTPQMNFTSTNYPTKEELQGKGIKSPLKLLTLKYLSQSSLVEQNRNPSSPKRIHFINLIVILNKEDEAKEEGNVKSNTTEYKDHEMTVEREEEFEEETEEEIQEEEEDSPKRFDTFPTIKELRYHEWL
ncbi:MAK10-like protein, partial [Tanacetum coccineum]